MLGPGVSLLVLGLGMFWFSFCAFFLVVHIVFRYGSVTVDIRIVDRRRFLNS